jgi:hypothetical protein
MSDHEITTAQLTKLFDTTQKTIADLSKREIIVSAGKRSLAATAEREWLCEASARARRHYCVVSLSRSPRLSEHGWRRAVASGLACWRSPSGCVSPARRHALDGVSAYGT